MTHRSARRKPLSSQRSDESAVKCLSDLEAEQRRSARFRFFLRVAVFLCLSVTVVIVGYYSYTTLTASQRRSQRDQYSAITKKIRSTILTSIANKQRSLAVVTAHALHFCPSKSSWPLCYIPFDYFQHTFNPLNHITQTESMGFAPRVAPSQMSTFEDFAYNFYKQSGYPKLGISDFGKGIFTVNLTTGEHIRLTNTTLGERKYDMLLVVLHTTNSSVPTYSQLLMLDLYSLSSSRKALIEFVTNCVEVQKKSASECTGVSDFFVSANNIKGQETSMRASVTIIYPIVTKDAPHTLVGVLNSGFTWDAFLSLAANERVSGIMVVLSNSEGQSYSLVYENGQAVQIGPGDFHDHAFDFQKVSFQATRFGGATNYTVSIYPTHVWMALFENDLPILACVVAVGIVVFSSLAFISYDFFMNREAVHRERLLRTKRRYIRFISHEMRTPMNVVHLGFTLLQHELTAKLEQLDTILKKPSSLSSNNLSQGRSRNYVKRDSSRPRAIKALEKWKAAVKEIIDNTDSSINILNDLINSDKLDAGQLALQKERVSLSLVMGHLEETFSERAKNVFLEFSPPQVPHNQEIVVDVDRVKLENILSRIMVNAFLYTPERGHVTVSVSWEAERQGWCGWIASVFQVEREKHSEHNAQRGMIHISVKNTGSGISKQQLERIYRDTALFDTDELHAGKGSGLGLWIARGILRLHGGQLRISSPGVDLGTEVVISLPATLTSHCGGVRESTTAVTEEGKRNPYLRFPRVLVVDDSKPTCKILCRLLIKSGFTASQCHDGEECIEFMQKVLAGENHPIDLILLDSEMPRMGGPETAKALRSMGIAVPIIGVTGHTLPEDLQRFLDSGATRVLMKPVTMASLNNILQEL